MLTKPADGRFIKPRPAWLRPEMLRSNRPPRVTAKSQSVLHVEQGQLVFISMRPCSFGR